MVRIADDIDPFAALEVGPDAPRELSILTELLPTGIDTLGQKQVAKRSYGRLALQEGDSVDLLCRRVRPWLEAHVVLPRDVRIGFKEIIWEDPSTFRDSVQGVRTILLKGEALISNDDVVLASAAIDDRDPVHYQLTVKLTRNAEQRFRVASSESANREVAILFDGRVDGTIVLAQEVRGGFLTVKMGKSELLDDGARLASGLARAKH